MASSLKNISQPIIPKKRLVDISDDTVHDETRIGHRRVMQKYPPPKMRFGVQVIRDFPPFCGITNGDSTGSRLQRLPLKNLSNDTRRTGKVKFWDPTCKENTTPHVASQKEQVRRNKIKEAMIMFDHVNMELIENNKLKPKAEKIAHFMVSVEAAKMVKQKLKWMEPVKKLGSILGVEIGDKFKYRSQLQMVGLHCQPQSGIDYTKIEGKNVAISIVDSNQYLNESKMGSEFYYSGQGGVAFFGDKNRPPVDQKLERGNLALKNSMDEKTPVRVIRKLKDVFVYDGVYNVNTISQKKGSKGNMVFIFQLSRVPGQPPLHKMLNIRP